jgi:hypothetical protein
MYVYALARVSLATDVTDLHVFPVVDRHLQEVCVLVSLDVGVCAQFRKIPCTELSFCSCIFGGEIVCL